jgi:hypothetical protein
LNDPALAEKGREIASPLNLMGGGGSTLTLPVWTFNDQLLAETLARLHREAEAFAKAYYGGDATGLAKFLEKLSAEPDLPLFAEGLMNALSGGGPGGSTGGGTGGPPPIGCGALGVEWLLLGIVTLLKGLWPRRV